MILAPRAPPLIFTSLRLWTKGAVHVDPYTYARCGGIFNNLFTANLLQNLPVIFLSWLMFDRIRVCGLVFGPLCMWNVKLIRKVNKVKQLRLQINDVTHN